MATRTRIWARPLLLALVVAGLWRADAPAAAGRTVVHGGTSAQRALVQWALDRYGAAGLRLPPVQVWFHTDPRDCGGGNSGFYAAGRLDVCVGDVTPYARNVIVHELAHAWQDRNLDRADERRFLRLRGLATWNSWDVPWAFRGTEQAAEIMTWFVGDQAIPPLLEGDDDPEQLLGAYETLTGSPPSRWSRPGPGA